MTKPRAGNWLIFVDTNIMLDFYRMPGESAERQISSLERHLPTIIVTEQVKMEFLKNRQKVIIDSIGKLVTPPNTILPMILSGTQTAMSLQKDIEAVKKRAKSLQQKVESILTDPSRNDPVYRGLNRLFASNHKYNLKRPDKRRFDIREQAEQRCKLGYPPRKAADTSIGDALNWEWIIRCAKESTDNSNVLIVSRDGDFGASYGKSVILNDWLRAEFKARVSRSRKIELTNKLTDALKVLDENVTAEDVEAESNVLNRSLLSFLNTDTEGSSDYRVWMDFIKGMQLTDPKSG